MGGQNFDPEKLENFELADLALFRAGGLYSGGGRPCRPRMGLRTSQVVAALAAALLAYSLFNLQRPRRQDRGLRLYRNCSFWTGNEQWSRALVSNAEGDIVDIGDEAMLRKDLASFGLPYEETDLLGGFCFPGLVDAHVHMIMGGSFLGYTSLEHVRSRTGFEEAIRSAAADLRPVSAQ